MKSVVGIAMLLATAVTGTSALGINCEGSFWCSFANDNVAQDLADLISGIDQGRWFENGEHIACQQSSGSYGAPDADGDIGFCAFLQYMEPNGGAWGSDIAALAQYIPDHGCRVCGSVPFNLPSGDNNVYDGELTFNMVTMSSDTQCTQGLC